MPSYMSSGRAVVSQLGKVEAWKAEVTSAARTGSNGCLQERSWWLKNHTPASGTGDADDRSCGCGCDCRSGRNDSGGSAA